MITNVDSETLQTELKRISYRTGPFVDGCFTEAISGKSFKTLNPTTQEPLATVSACDTADVDVAVKTARRAFEDGRWTKLTPADKKKRLRKWAELVEKHALEIALLDALEAGKPISECLNGDIPELVTCLEWYAETIDKVYDEIAPTEDSALGLVVREPVGVVGAVIPWNFPAMLVGWKAGPILAAGNTLVLKPAEQSSLSALRLAELAMEADIPPGVFNVIPGYGETAGRAIGEHMDIDAVTFTGSTAIGREFLKYSAMSNMKRVLLECGGKSPQLVLRSARDLGKVADHAVNAAYWNMGENCSCGSRLIVHRDIKDELLDEIEKRSRKFVMGDPLAPNTTLGPMIEKEHFDKVSAYIESGLKAGAKVRFGGKADRRSCGGYFVEPTAFDDVTSNMQIARDEIFGPVLSTIVYDDIGEAVRLANDTNYGLAASLYTDDLKEAHVVSRQLRAGTVSVNCFSEGDITTPFGGYRQSGFFGRDKSLRAFEQYMETKTVWIDLS